MLTIYDKPNIVEPPAKFIKQAEHHWVDLYNGDGHYFGRIVLQWAPQAKKWCHSGNVGTGIYVELDVRSIYVQHCPMPV